MPISKGDRGRLVTRGLARSRDARLPVEVRGSLTSIAVPIIGSHADRVTVAPDDDGEIAAERDPGTEPDLSEKRYTPLGFWLGFPFVLFMAVVCWMGVRHAVDQVRTEEAVYREGVLTTGTVEQKLHYHQTEPGERTHYVVSAFRSPAGFTLRKEINVDAAMWDALREQGPIRIRYVPANPELNLSDGRHMADLYYMGGGIALVAALTFSIISAGMLVKKLSGGYRGETGDP